MRKCPDPCPMQQPSRVLLRKSKKSTLSGDVIWERLVIGIPVSNIRYLFCIGHFHENPQKRGYSEKKQSIRKISWLVPNRTQRAKPAPGLGAV